ncbi:EamA family transporter [Paenibacillus tianjinensis]|uniref:EamA family transporter n=1 Tax=Paenibacillus tianjinensis TaxID=2810347 RepID=A0ABX7LIA5_9BACL|nr:EamA family transporter [Paenibacillus tianjinensis]
MASCDFHGFICSVLPYLWWNQGISLSGANKTSLFFNIVPISAMAISALSGESIVWLNSLALL